MLRQRLRELVTEAGPGGVLGTDLSSQYRARHQSPLYVDLGAALGTSMPSLVKFMATVPCVVASRHPPTPTSPEGILFTFEAKARTYRYAKEAAKSNKSRAGGKAQAPAPSPAAAPHASAPYPATDGIAAQVPLGVPSGLPLEAGALDPALQALSDRLQLVLLDAGAPGALGSQLPLLYHSRHHVDLASEVLRVGGDASESGLLGLMCSFPFVDMQGAKGGADVRYTHTAFAASAGPSQSGEMIGVDCPWLPVNASFWLRG